MKDIDLGWLCGFLEGEASFSLQRYNHKNPPGSKSPHRQDTLLLIRASQVDRSVLERVLSITGVGKITSKKTHSPISKKQQFEWRVQKRDEIRYLLPIIRPHMSDRRKEKIDEMLKFLIK